MPASQFSIQQAADHLGVSTKTVRRYIALGYLDAHRIGPRLIRISATSLERLAGGHSLAA